MTPPDPTPPRGNAPTPQAPPPAPATPLPLASSLALPFTPPRTRVPGLALMLVLTLGGALAAEAAAGAAGGAGTIPGLSERLKREAARAGGDVAVHVTHLPSGRWAALDSARPQPLYSVYKLAVAVAVLKEVEAGRLALDRQVEVTSRDLPPGGVAKDSRWKPLPKVITVQGLLEMAIVDSDNLATDKLQGLIGGPATIMRQLRAARLPGIDVKFLSREQSPDTGKLNRGSAEAINRLLVRLQTGDLLKAPHRSLLIDMMTRSPTGLNRLRGNLPPGTVVADKTGTGPDGSVTNDVGLITLPGGEHLAISILISGSSLPHDGQVALIATLARIAYDTVTGK